MTTVAQSPDREGTLGARTWEWANRHRKWVLASPALAFTVLMIAFPIGWTIYLSLTNAFGSVRSPFSFVGLHNYVVALTDTNRFWPAVGRTFVFTVGALVLELTAGMCVALLLWRPFKAQGAVRVIVLLPFVATPVAIAMMWRLILDPNIGFANELLGWIGIDPQPWFASSSATLPTLILVDTWEFTPMIAIVLLAGLSALPHEVDEAARIDGAGAWQRFWYVTLPLLRPVMLVAVMLRAIDALKTFDLLYAVKGPGGGSFHEAETLNLYAYTLSFQYNNFGLASAVLVIFFVIILIVLGLLAISRRAKS